MPTQHPARVCIRDLRKRYGPIVALDGVTFEVEPGHIFGLLGRNGAGKTTTLECLLGMRNADHGSVSIDGLDPRSNPTAFKSMVGAQLQGASLQDKITPKEALKLLGAFYRTALPADALLEKFGLTAKRDAPFETLSAGQRQRLFLALAFVNQPRVVVLDEPTTGLDPQSRRDLHVTILELKTSGVTVLLSTHYLEEAEELCDTVGILHHGRILAQGRPADLISTSRRKPTVVLRTRAELATHVLLQLSNVVAADLRDKTWHLETLDPAETIADAAAKLKSSHITALEIRNPSLEDVFIELTGTRWSPAAHETEASGGTAR
jgi:ABC-2 type transport system ATP-binding protein